MAYAIGTSFDDLEWPWKTERNKPVYQILLSGDMKTVGRYWLQ